MLDVEVIDNCRYGVVEADSAAARLIKAVNSTLMMQRLASEDGVIKPLSETTLRTACRQAGVICTKHDLEVLMAYGLIEYKQDFGTYDYSTGRYVGIVDGYLTTALGSDTLKRLKSGEEEIFIPL